MSTFYIGVDVGSYSVRSGIFISQDNITLKLIKKHEVKIEVFNDLENIFEQSSENIWNSICKATQTVIIESNVHPSTIKGIGFDATCSLVCLDKNENPLSISCTNRSDERNIIMWMDLRAKSEADFINNTDLKALKTYGGKISVEMQPPKLMWLKKNIPRFMSTVGFVFDLPDYLVYRATNTKIRSLCSVTCKWAFDAENHCWDRQFWEKCDLKELCDNNFEIIGNEFYHPGDFIKEGLSEKAANELGLIPNIQVPTSLIDAYAGVLGAISCSKQLVTIAGTSACHMIVIPQPVFINGIWGPFKNVLMKDWYVLEAGQITVGNLLDKILKFSEQSLSHFDAAIQLLEAVGETNHRNDILSLPSDQWYRINILSKDIHINPDFAGNRNPRSDFKIRGSIIGLNIDSSKECVAKLYLATIQATMYGFKEILDQFLLNNIEIDSIVLCGGLSKNQIFSRVLADVSGLAVYLAHDEDLVLLGAAKLNLDFTKGLFLDNKSSSLMKINPDFSLTKYHMEKYGVYKRIIDFQDEIKDAISLS